MTLDQKIYFFAKQINAILYEAELEKVVHVAISGSVGPIQEKCHVTLETKSNHLEMTIKDQHYASSEEIQEAEESAVAQFEEYVRLA